MNIICLLWKGDFRNRDYCDNDVLRLKQTIDKHIDRDYEFYCLTNDMSSDVPAKKISLKNNWPGYWSKVELFRKDLPKGRTLYLDLDTHIINGLQPVLDYEGELVMFPTPYTYIKNRSRKMVIQRYQAGTMLFTPGALSWVYKRFRINAMNYIKYYRSEQDMYGEWLPNQPTFPAQWMLKTSNLRRGKTRSLKDVIIITGRPVSDSFRRPSFAPWLEEMARGEEKCT